MKGPLCWIGGKFRLAKQIVARFPEHVTYCEAFAGGAHVLFRKEPSKVEIINDANRDLVSLFQVLQNHLEEFVRQFRWCLVSRGWWDDWTEQLKVGGLTDIQRAARFYYVQRLGFGGKVYGRTFGGGPTQGPRINLLRLEEELSDVHVRLTHVRIENLPYGEFIARHDRPETLFYLDPPYWGVENYYGKGLFGRDDFARLAQQLAGLQGKFLLSLNDTPGVRETFGAFSIGTLATKYSCARTEAKTVREVLISNY
ncbi:DNA adenine methylase [Fundidesulfovibrio butyratiphilus]